ncbi:MAG TPA: hypothetical protein VHV79_04915 [Mycobacteriales bacterium]|jgi:photosystem II stability/assembly factor-like uncharacterized protein|nr:hypothetical protein [Mycobacteriales bacterium]
MTPDERDLEALLRQPAERLAPPDHSWEKISRRASRRKWVKASLSVAAGVVVVAGAVPAMIAVRADHNNGTSIQSLTSSQNALPNLPRHTVKRSPIPTAPAPSSAPAVPDDLVGFLPASVSFVSQQHGYAWGNIGRSPQGVIAQTWDAGETWTKLPAPAVDNSVATSGHDGDSQIRYSSATTGFVFGAKYFVTHNAGGSWSEAASPGYIDDLEATHNHRVWALVRKTENAPTVALYTAAPASSDLQAVTKVAAMSSQPGADSIAVNQNQVYVVAGDAAFWTSRNGTDWQEQPSPCPASAGAPQHVLLTTLNRPGIYAVCSYRTSGGGESQQTYLSVNTGKTWTQTAASPAAGGAPQTFAAGSENDIIVGTSRGGAQVTHNGGKTWLSDQPPGGVQLGFVGFIKTQTVVGVGTSASGTAGVFATSLDSGRKWTVTNFSR